MIWGRPMPDLNISVPQLLPATQRIDGQVYYRNAVGALVPAEQVREVDIARTDLVLELAAKAKALQKALREFKAAAAADVDAFIDLSAERYDVAHGGSKGNVTLPTYDGGYQLKRQISDYIVFDEGIQAAKALIDECLRDWTKDSRGEIRALIDEAFQVNKEGKSSPSRILGLSRLDIADERWQRAMTAIGESIRVTGSRAYIRFYERGPNGKMEAITLNMATL